MGLVTESLGTAASSPTPGCPSTSVRSSTGCTGSSVGGGGAVAVVPEEKEIDPPAR